MLCLDLTCAVTCSNPADTTTFRFLTPSQLAKGNEFVEPKATNYSPYCQCLIDAARDEYVLTRNPYAPPPPSLDIMYAGIWKQRIHEEDAEFKATVAAYRNTRRA